MSLHENFGSGNTDAAAIHMKRGYDGNTLIEMWPDEEE